MSDDWRQLYKNSVVEPEELARILDVDPEPLQRVHARYPMRTSRYYLDLVQSVDCPIGLQVVPNLHELDSCGQVDPLGEENHSPNRAIVHRYPDRALFYVSYRCATHCRFCSRKRRVDDPKTIDANERERGLRYIAEHEELRDIIVSGGDPLLLGDDELEDILTKLREIKHVQIIRLDSRLPVTLPQRVTEKLCSLLKNFQPLYLNTHFNHPREITPAAKRACAALADAGIPLGNQSVLLKGVNDSPSVMRELVHGLLRLRVKPYYLYQCDPVIGACHFRCPVDKGLEIISSLQGHTSGLAVPHFVLDGPQGKGKVTVAPDHVVSRSAENLLLRNYAGQSFEYPDGKS